MRFSRVLNLVLKHLIRHFESRYDVSQVTRKTGGSRVQFSIKITQKFCEHNLICIIRSVFYFYILYIFFYFVFFLPTFFGTCLPFSDI